MSLFDFFNKKGNEKEVSQSMIRQEEPVIKQEESKQNTDLNSPKSDIYQEYYEHYDQHRCPDCQYDFGKAVTRKRKCPECQNTMIVRTHYSSKKKMLLKEEMLEVYEEEVKAYYEEEKVQRDYDWAAKRVSSLGIDETEVERKKAEGYSIYDVLWGALNKQQMEYAQKYQWGLYRNSFLTMAEVLEHEGKNQKAFHFYLGLCFIDLNGPRNAYVGADKPFDPEMDGFLAPGILVKIVDFKKDNNLNLEEVKKNFLAEADRMKNQLMPLSPEEAWDKFEKEFLKAEKDLATYGYIKN